MVLTKPGMVLIYNGVEYTVGASVIATDQSVYRGLYGKITEIRSDGDKETDNVGPDIYCAFEQPVLHDEIIALEKSFSTLYGAPRSMDEIIFDPVIMAPEMVQQLEGDTQDRSLTVYRYAETVLKDRNMTIISGEWNDICAFKYTQGGYYIYMDAEVKDATEKGKCTPKDLKAQLFYYKNGNSFDPDDKEIVLDSINFGDDMSAWIYEDNNENMNRLKYGKKYYLGINNYSDSNYKIHYKIMYYPTGSADKVTMPKQITVKLAEYGTIKPEKIEPATGFSNIEEWKTSNKNLEILGTPDGKCEIYAKKKGTTYTLCHTSVLREWRYQQITGS